MTAVKTAVSQQPSQKIDWPFNWTAVLHGTFVAASHTQFRSCTDLQSPVPIVTLMFDPHFWYHPTALTHFFPRSRQLVLIMSRKPQTLLNKAAVSSNRRELNRVLTKQTSPQISGMNEIVCEQNKPSFNCLLNFVTDISLTSRSMAATLRENQGLLSSRIIVGIFQKADNLSIFPSFLQVK